MSGFLGNPAAAGGSGMVNTLFGSQMGTIQNAIAQKTGLPPAAVGKVLEIAAPMVMGYVGKMFVQQKMDTKSLTGLLGDQSKMALQASPDAAAMSQQLMGAQESKWRYRGHPEKSAGKITRKTFNFYKVTGKGFPEFCLSVKILKNRCNLFTAGR